MVCSWHSVSLQHFGLLFIIIPLTSIFHSYWFRLCIFSCLQLFLGCLLTYRRNAVKYLHIISERTVKKLWTWGSSGPGNYYVCQKHGKQQQKINIIHFLCRHTKIIGQNRFASFSPKESIIGKHFSCDLMLERKQCQCHVQNVLFIVLTSSLHMKEWSNSFVSTVWFGENWRWSRFTFFSIFFFTAPALHSSLTLECWIEFLHAAAAAALLHIKKCSLLNWTFLSSISILPTRCEVALLRFK